VATAPLITRSGPSEHKTHKWLVGFAASLYNMMRNNAWRLSNLGQPTPGSMAFNYLPQLITGQKQGLGMVYGMIQAQAAMLSFNDL